MDDPLTGYVRVKVICLFRHEGRLLAIDDFDPTKEQRFWVPVGGRVEFGESSRQAIIREVREDSTQRYSTSNLAEFSRTSSPSTAAKGTRSSSSTTPDSPTR